jgi:hypothetical protein
MQVFMGQSWADHNQDFLARALRADRITFADLGVVRRHVHQWEIEHESTEARAFYIVFQTAARRVAS